MLAPIAQSHPQKRTRISYTEEEIERGLVATALASGNTRLAAQILAGEGLPIPRSTLQSWVNRIHPQRYEEVRARELPRLREFLAEKHTAAAERYLRLEQRVADRIEDSLEEIPARDLPGASRNLAVSGAVHLDKAQLLRDQPTTVVHHRSIEEVERDLRAHGVEIIDGFAEEVEEVGEPSEGASQA